MRTLLGIITISLFPVMVFGQWHLNSPNSYTTTVYSFIQDGNILVAGRDDGLIMAPDTGVIWGGLPSSMINANESVYCFGRNSSTFFAGTSNSIYSSSSALFWPQSYQTGVSTYGFANVDETVFAATFGGVLKSENNGGSWLISSVGIETDSIYSIVAKGGVLFAGTYGHGIYKSSDNGNTWTTVNNGIPLPILIRTIATDGDILIAGTSNSSVPSISSHGVFRSDDNGNSWQQITDGVDSEASTIMVRCIQGVFLLSVEGSYCMRRSVNGGISWTDFNDGMENPAFPYRTTDFYETDDYIFIGLSGQCTNMIRRRNKYEIHVTSIEEQSKRPLLIHPNPATDHVTVLLRNGTCSGYTLHDAMGREVVSEMFAAPSVRFEVGLSHLASGIYTLHARTPAGPAVVRVVKE